MRAGLAAALLAALAGASGAAETTLRVRLDSAHRTLTGRERVVFRNPGSAPLASALFWLYPNRLRQRPAALDDVDMHWVYPLEFNPGFMNVVDARVEGQPVRPRVRDDPHAGPATLLEVPLPAPLAPGGRVEIELAWEVLIPERYGPFGCWDDGCTLLGGYYPMLAALTRDGWDQEAPPQPSRFAADFEVDREVDAVAGDAVRHGTAFSVGTDAATHLPLVVAPELHVAARVVDGVLIRYLTRTEAPPADDAVRQIIPYTQENYSNMVLDTAADAIGIVAGTGAAPPAGTVLTLVQAPLRVELASAQPGMVVVSDRMFRILPSAATRKYHARELARAVFTALLARGRGGLPGRERDTAAEAGAAYLLDLYELGVEHGHDTARDLLGPVDFVPQIDNVIYAPQIPFADAYFGSIADGDRFRDDVRRFNSDRARGSVLYQKLRDLLTPAELAATMRRVVLEPVTVRQAAPARRDLQGFFEGWGHRYPMVDYRLGRIVTRRLPDGRWRHVITVEKRLPPGTDWPVEPVPVRVVDGAGNAHDLVWDGAGTHGELALVTDGEELESVQLDPARRLVESSPGEDPRFDDRTPPRWKLLYNGLGVVVNATDLTVGLFVDLPFRRLHDLHHLGRVQLFTDETTTIGLALGYTYRFGPKVTPAKLADSVGTTLTMSRLSPGFGLAPSAGTRVSLSAAVGTDDRLTLFEPTHGTIASFGARYTVTRFDAGGDLLQTGTVSGSVGQLWTPADNHTFSATASAAVLFGDIVARPQLLGVGGPGGLEGYSSSELFGRAYLLGHLEWRSVIRHDLDWNLGHVVRLRGFGAAAFLDAALLASCSGYDDVDVYASVGVGFNLLYADLGVQPSMSAIEVSTPLVVRPRQCLGASNLNVSGSRPPVMITLRFFPTF